MSALGLIIQGVNEPVRAGVVSEVPAPMLRRLTRRRASLPRAAAAVSLAVPSDAHSVPAGDTEQRVRALLASKLAALAPDFASNEDQVWKALAALVQDETARVRATIAGIVKEMPEAPRDLIVGLVHEAPAPVPEWLARLWPFLSRYDMVALLAASPSASAIDPPAHRADLVEPITDVSACIGDNSVAAVLLANPTPSVRETILDALIARAQDQIGSQEQGPGKPKLSPPAARALSQIITTYHVGILAGRNDIHSALIGELQERLRVRLGNPSGGNSCPKDGMISASNEPALRVSSDPPLVGHPEIGLSAREALRVAHAIASEGMLNEHALSAAIERGEVRLAAALLALAAQVPFIVVDRACRLRSAKGLIALAWAAGFTADVIAPLQMLLARLRPGQILPPSPSGDFPLTPDQMRWQLDFLGRSAA
ncbi:MAG: DUF2336 domain-containing protein [Acetobacteraceae bacterium]|nr:DUF2336 domain-containing protein [Acetobacteraceae bacterium]MBV8592306.1 DUF2336 domain-containing protein [Acetobacteraceae bacterium]